MRTAALLLSLAPIALVSLPASAATPCAEQIALVERRLQSEGAVAVTGNPTGAPVTTGSDEAPGPVAPADPAASGVPLPSPENIAAARAIIEEARGYDVAGDNQACNDAMTRAKELIGPLP